MKRYVVFAGNVLGTPGGACDYVSDFRRLRDALVYRQIFLSLDRKKQQWCHVWDTKECILIPNQADEHGEAMSDTLE